MRIWEPPARRSTANTCEPRRRAEERRQLAERARRAETEAETNAVEAKDAQTLVERLKPGAESGLKGRHVGGGAFAFGCAQVRGRFGCPALETASTAEAQARKDKEEMEIDVRELSRAAQRLAFHERPPPGASFRAAVPARAGPLRPQARAHATLADNHRRSRRGSRNSSRLAEKHCVRGAAPAAKEDASTARAELKPPSSKRNTRRLEPAGLSLALDAVLTQGSDAFSQVEARKEIARRFAPNSTRASEPRARRARQYPRSKRATTAAARRAGCRR